MNFKLPYPIGKHTHFQWGPVVAIHSIPDIGVDIVEYRPPLVAQGGGLTGEYDQTRTQFHLYHKDGEDVGWWVDTLPHALVYAAALTQFNELDAGDPARAACKLLGLTTVKPDLGT